MSADQRPRVVVSVTATVDGRVALGAAERLLDDDAGKRWRAAWPPDAEDLLERRAAFIEQRHHPDVVLEGSGTFVGPGAGPLDLPPSADTDLRQDYRPVESRKWFAVVDGRGRVAWTHKRDGDTSLLVLVNDSTPLPYLAYLRRETIPYVVAGDLPSALTKISARCVVSQAGGGLNGALLRAGLVDELHVITIPALAGGLGTPSMMDGPPLAPGAYATPLRTVDVVVGAHGTVWSHHEVMNARDHVDRFNRAVRSGDWSELVATLHPAAVMSFEGVPVGPFTGRDAIAAAYAAMPPDDTMRILGTRAGDDGAEVVRFAWSRGGTGTLSIRRGEGFVTELAVAFDRPPGQRGGRRSAAA